MVFDEQALDDLRGLDAAVRRRVRKKLEWLAERADQVRLDPLRDELVGLFKLSVLSVGDWRLVVGRDEERRLMVVHAIAHRRHSTRSPAAGWGDEPTRISSARSRRKPRSTRPSSLLPVAAHALLQEVRGEAKPYQVRQFLRLVERYNLRLENDR